jgi:hypothetical protein
VGAYHLLCSSHSASHASPQAPQSAAFNLSLDKYTQMRYSLVKVLLTVSPFRPSFLPQLNVFSREPRAVSPLSTAFTPNRPLTPLSTAFTQTHRGVGADVQTLTGSDLRASAPRETHSFDTLANSLSFRKVATPLQSSKSTLFAPNTRGGVYPARAVQQNQQLTNSFQGQLFAIQSTAIVRGHLRKPTLGKRALHRTQGGTCSGPILPDANQRLAFPGLLSSPIPRLRLPLGRRVGASSLGLW